MRSLFISSQYILGISCATYSYHAVASTNPFYKKNQSQYYAFFFPPLLTLVGLPSIIFVDILLVGSFLKGNLEFSTAVSKEPQADGRSTGEHALRKRISAESVKRSTPKADKLSRCQRLSIILSIIVSSIVLRTPARCGYLALSGKRS